MGMCDQARHAGENEEIYTKLTPNRVTPFVTDYKTRPEATREVPAEAPLLGESPVGVWGMSMRPSDSGNE